MQAYKYPAYLSRARQTKIFDEYNDIYDIFKLYEGFDGVDKTLFGIIIIVQDSKVVIFKECIGVCDTMLPSTTDYSNVEMINILKKSLSSVINQTPAVAIKFKRDYKTTKEVIRIKQIINYHLDIFMRKVSFEKLEEKSANKIANAWKSAITDPQYTLCVQRLQNEYSELVETWS